MAFSASTHWASAPSTYLLHTLRVPATMTADRRLLVHWDGRPYHLGWDVWTCGEVCDKLVRVVRVA